MAPQTENQAKRIIVHIYDQDIPLTTRGDAEFVKRTARYVDSNMKAVADAVQVKDPTKVAFVTCMNIAAELLTLREQHSQIVQELNLRFSSIAATLDRELSGLK